MIHQRKHRHTANSGYSMRKMQFNAEPRQIQWEKWERHNYFVLSIIHSTHSINPIESWFWLKFAPSTEKEPAIKVDHEIMEKLNSHTVEYKIGKTLIEMDI